MAKWSGRYSADDLKKIKEEKTATNNTQSNLYTKRYSAEDLANIRQNQAQQQQQQARQYLVTGNSALDAANAQRVQAGNDPVYTSTADMRNQLRLDKGLGLSVNKTQTTATPEEQLNYYNAYRQTLNEKKKEVENQIAALPEKDTGRYNTTGGLYDPTKNKPALGREYAIQQAQKTAEYKGSDAEKRTQLQKTKEYLEGLDRLAAENETGVRVILNGDEDLFEKYDNARTKAEGEYAESIKRSETESDPIRQYLYNKANNNSGHAAIEAAQLLAEIKNKGYTDEQVRAYMSFKNTKDAEALAQDIKKFTKEHPVGAAVAGVIMAPVRGAAVAGMIFRPGERNTPYNFINDYSQTVQETNTEAIGEAVKSKVGGKAGEYLAWAAEKGYQAAVASAESLITMQAGGKLGEVLMGLGAATETYNEALKNGLDTKRAIDTALAAGIFETLFEHISLEKLRVLQAKGKEGFGNACLDILRQFITEGSEEVFTDLSNELYDYLMNGGLSNYERTYRQYVENDNLSPEEAQNKYAWEFAKQLGESMVVGGLSGAYSAGTIRGTQAAGRTASYIGTGKAVQNAAKSTEGGIKSVLSPLTETLGESKESKTLENVTEKTGKYKTGKAVSQAVNAITETQVKTAKDALTAVGIDEKTADKKARTFVSMYDGNITAETVAAFVELANDEKSMAALTELLGDETEYQGRRTALETFRKNVIKAAEQHPNIIQRAAEKLDRWMRRDEIRQAAKRGEIADESVNAVEAKTTGELVTETEAKTDTGNVNVKGVSGIEDGKMQVVVDESGATADVDSVTFDDTEEGKRTAEIYRGVQRMMQGGTEYSVPMSVEGANLAIAFAQNARGDVNALLNELYTAYAAGTVAQDAGTYKLESKLDQGEAAFDAMYNAGIKEYKATPGVTRVGTTDMTQAQINELKVLDNVFRKMGIALVVTDRLYSLVNGKKVRLFGKTDGKTIYVGLKDENSDNVISVAAFHELFHWIQFGGKVSKGVQRGLVQAVIRTIKNQKDLNYDEIYEQRAAVYTDLTQEEIEEEIAAQYFGTLMADRLAATEIFNSVDQSVWEKIMDHVREFFLKVHDAIEEFAKRENDRAMIAAINTDMDAAEHLLKSIDAALRVSMQERSAAEGSTETGERTEEEPRAGPESIIEDSAKVIKNSLAFSESGEHAALLEKEWTDEAALPKSTVTERYEKIIDIWKQIGASVQSEFLTAWDKKVGKDRAFDIFKAQSGYKYNAELASMCKKGIALFDAIDTLVKDRVMEELKLKELGKHEKEILYDILKDHGHEIPCAICYVEQARQREGTIINDFVNGNKSKKKIGWNEAIDQIEERMRAKGENYTFAVMDIAKADYTPVDAVMSSKEQNAFYEAVYELVNEEITRANKTAKKKRALAKEATPKGITKALKGSITLNLRVYKSLVNELQSRYRLPKYALYSSVATQNIAKANHELYKTFNMQGGVSGFKTKQTPVVYWGDILRMGAKPDSVRKAGGMRWQSNSDFQMYTFLDRVQYFVDMTAKGYYHQEYTKVPASLKLFGLMGGKQNASLIPAVHIYRNADGSMNEELTRENAGLDENGEPIYDKVEGMDPEEAFLLLTDKDYSRNVGTICVAYSDNHIRKLLSDARTSMVIGYHDKTNDPAKRYRGAIYAHNYNGENEARNANGETVHVDFSKYLIKAEKKFKKTGDGFTGNTVFEGKEYTADDIPRLAADMYLSEIRAKGWTPAYQKFADHENYYKLLADYTLVDSEGHYAPQGKVKFFLPDTVPVRTVDKNGNVTVTEMDTAEYIQTELQKELRERDAIARDLADETEDGIIPQFKQAVMAETAGMKQSRALDEQIEEAREKLKKTHDGTIILPSERFNQDRSGMLHSRVLNQNAEEYVERMKTGSRERWAIMDVFREMVDAQAAFRVLDETEENMAKWRQIARKYVYAKEGKGGGVTQKQIEELATRINSAYRTIIDSGNIEAALYELYSITRDQIERAGHYEVIADSLVKDFRAEFRPNGKRVTIYIPENVVTDVSEYYGGKGAFRNAMYGMMNITYDSSQGMPLDEFYDSLVQSGYGLQETSDPSEQVRNMQTLYNAYETEWVSDKEGILADGRTVDDAATDAAISMMADMISEGAKGSKKFRQWKNRISELQEEVKAEQREGILKVLAEADAELEARLDVLNAQDVDSVTLEAEAERLRAEYALEKMRNAYSSETDQVRQGVNGDEMRMTDEQYQSYLEQVEAARSQEKERWQQINADQQRWWQQRYAETKGKWEGRYDQQQEWWKQRYAETKENLQKRYQGKYDEQQKWWQQRYADSKKIWEGKYADQQDWWRKYYQNKLDEKQQWYQDSLVKDTRQRQIKQELKALTDIFTNDKKAKFIPLEMQSDLMAFIQMFTDDQHVITSTSVQKLLDVINKQMVVDVNPDAGSLFANFDEDLMKELNSLRAELSAAEQAKTEDRAKRGLGPTERVAIGADGKVYTQFMTVDQLDILLDVIKHVRFIVENANSAMLDERRINLSDFGKRQMESAKQDEPGKMRKLLQDKIGEIPFIKMLTPIYYFEELVGGPMGEVYEAIRNGQDKWMWRVMESAQALQKARTDAKYNEWKNRKFEIHLTEKLGRKAWDAELTVDELIYIYTLLRRETESGYESTHLIDGGIVLENEIKKKTLKEKLQGLRDKNKKNDEETKKENLGKMVDAAAHQISFEELQELTGQLTDEMKAYGDALVEFLSTVCSEWGNEASVKLTGLKRFTETYYIPFVSAKNYLHTRLGVSDDTRLKNAGFTKRRQQGANTPLIVKGISDVAMEHAEHMARYSSFAVPLDTLNRLYNYGEWIVDDEGKKRRDPNNVKTALKTAYGQYALDYIDTFVQQLNGGVRSRSNEKRFNRFVGWFKRSAVLGNLSVVMQQPSALMRAMAMVDLHYFFGAFRKADYDDMMAHSAIAVLKQMGGFDTMTGRSAVEWMLNNEKTTVEKAAEILSKGAEFADAVAWTNIWNAVKREMKDAHPDVEYGSDAYYDLVNKRFRDVIDYTQVYDSTLSKSEYMRDNSAFMKMLMAFQGEPTLSLNILMVNGKKHKIKTGAAIAAFIGNIIVNSALKSIVGAWRDDDEDETGWEKWLEKFFSDLVGDWHVLFLDGAWSPVAMIPYVKDILSLVQGYNVDRSDVSVFSGLINSAKYLIKETFTDEGPQMPSIDTIMDLAGAITSMTPIPMGKAMKDIKGIIVGFMSNVVYDYYDATAETAKRAILSGLGFEQNKIDKAYRAVLAKDEETKRRFLAYKDSDVQKAADKGYTDPVRQVLIEKEKTYHGYVQSGLIDHDKRIKLGAKARYAGNYDLYESIILEVMRDGFEENDVVTAMNTLYKKMLDVKPMESKEPEDKALYSTDDLDVALKNDDVNTFSDVKSRMLESGIKTEKQISKYAKDYAADRYEENLDAEEAKHILTAFAGYSDEDAGHMVDKWRFEQIHPDSSLTDTRRETWESSLQNVMTVERYESYLADVAAVKEETDDVKERKKEVVRLIKAITDNKDARMALWTSAGYGETTFEEQKWND